MEQLLINWRWIINCQNLDNATNLLVRCFMPRKYSKSTSKDVTGAMRKRKRGTLRSGGSGKKVTSRKQAIAIGLSEARRKGKKVPKRKAKR